MPARFKFGAINPKGALVADLTHCVDRDHPDRAGDCRGGLAFMIDVREVLKTIDLALDRIEQVLK